jgi:hypothetical protein
MLFSLIGLDEAATDVVETTNQSTMFDNFFSILMIAVGVFAIYSAITGKGPAFRNDYPASMQKESTKFLQKFLWIIGPVSLITGVLDFVYKDSMWPYLASVIIIVPTIVIYMILFRRKFKEDLKRMR